MNMRLCFLLGVILLVVSTSNAKNLIGFIPNKGQWNAEVQYRAVVPGGYVYVTQNSIVYQLFDEKAMHSALHHQNLKKPMSVYGHAFELKFKDGSVKSFLEYLPSTVEYNFHVGEISASKLRAYNKLVLKDVWEGIDIEFIGEEQSFKYNIIVSPKADPEKAQFIINGLESFEVINNELFLRTQVGTIQENTPVSFITPSSDYIKNDLTDAISTQFLLKGNVLSFKPSKHNKNKFLIIDPNVVFASFSGSVADNFGFTATFDSLGNTYAGGTVYAANFPITMGVFQMTYGGGVNDMRNQSFSRDCGILKFSDDGSQLLYATYLGGNHNEQPHSMIVNSKNELIIYGTTESVNFPMRGNPYKSFKSNGIDIFIAKLSENGSTLVSSTFYGGNGDDGINGDFLSYTPGSIAYNYGDNYRGEVIIDSNDNIYIASNTKSLDLPLRNPIQANKKGDQDGCIAWFSADLQNLLWATYWGGSGMDGVFSITLDEKEDIYVCGGTSSPDLVTTADVPQENKTFKGNIDGFLARFIKGDITVSPPNITLASALYIGSSTYDNAYFVRRDTRNDIYVTGQTLDRNFPISPNTFHVDNSTQFIQIFDNELKSLKRSTVFGSGRSSIDLSPGAFEVDLCNRILYSGWGGNTNRAYNNFTGLMSGLLISNDAYQKTSDGSDFYIAIFEPDIQGVSYGSYLGGAFSEEHVDGGTSRFDRNGIVYQSVCGGCGGYSDFPTTDGAWSNINRGRRPQDPTQGGCNNAVFKMDLNTSLYRPEFKDTILVVEAGTLIDFAFDVTDKDPDDIVFADISGSIFDNVNLPLANFIVEPGRQKARVQLIWQTNCSHVSTDTYTVFIRAFDNGCPVSREAFGVIKIVVNPLPPLDPPKIFCLNRLNGNTIRINWNETDNSQDFKHVNLIKQYPNGTTELLGSFKRGDVKEYIDNNAPSHIEVDYCYFMYSVNTCDLAGDSTRYECSIPDEDSIPKPVYIHTATVVNNKNIKVVWTKYKKDDFYAYQVYRKKVASNEEFELYALIGDANDSVFVDSNVSVSEYSYCYRIAIQGQCFNSNFSNDGCTILLEGEAIPFVNKTFWNNYQTWQGGVRKYDLYRRDPSKGDSVIISLFDSKTKNNYEDDSLNYDEGLYWYKVIAQEAVGGQNATSESNEIRLVQKPIVYPPNGFSPNDDDINDKWHPVPIFVKDYKLTIYNRWGQFLWQTESKKELWDGFFKTLEPMEGVVVWQLDYTGWDNSKHYRVGNLTIIK